MTESRSFTVQFDADTAVHLIYVPTDDGGCGAMLFFDLESEGKITTFRFGSEEIHEVRMDGDDLALDLIEDPEESLGLRTLFAAAMSAVRQQDEEIALGVMA